MRSADVNFNFSALMPSEVASSESSSASSSAASIASTTSASSASERLLLNEEEEEGARREEEEEPETERCEVLGWISYGFAVTVVPQAAIQVFCALLLSKLAEGAGRYAGSGLPCVPTSSSSASASASSTSTVRAVVSLHSNMTASSSSSSSVGVFSGDQCEVYFGPIGYVPVVSFVMYLQAVAVLLQTVAFVSLGALADYGRWRKTLLMFFSILGSACCILILTTTDPALYWLAALLFILINVFYGATTIFYNAFLPILIRCHPAVRRAHHDPSISIRNLNDDQFSLLGASVAFNRLRNYFRRQSLPVVPADKHNDNHDDGADDDGKNPTLPTFEAESSAIVEPEKPPAPVFRHARSASAQSTPSAHYSREQYERLTALEDRLGNTLSTHSFAVGYLAVLFIFAICGGILYAMNMGSPVPLAICVAINGVWWMVFSIPTWLFLKTRPGPPLPENAKNVVFFSWKETFRAIQKCRRLPNTFMYLTSNVIFSASFAAIGQVAVLFAQNTVKMPDTQILIALVLAAVSATAGSYFWLWVSRRFALSTKTTLMVLIMIALLMPIYGLLGLLPDPGTLKIADGFELGIGLRTSLEMLIAVTFFGSVLGPVMSFSRVVYTDLLPRTHEAEFLALCEIMKGAVQWLQPLVLAAITTAAGGEMRYGFFFIFVSLVVSVLILWRLVDVPGGRLDCEAFYEENVAERVRARVRPRRSV